MQLTSFTDYGLRSLMYLAAFAPKKCSVREIADYYGISRHHLVKVIHRLAQFGLVASTKGKGGGIMLAVSASELRIGDLVQKLEPNMHVVECFDPQKNTCKITNTCKLKHTMFEANESFITSLNRYTLADMV